MRARPQCHAAVVARLLSQFSSPLLSPRCSAMLFKTHRCGQTQASLNFLFSVHLCWLAPCPVFMVTPLPMQVLAVCLSPYLTSSVPICSVVLWLEG